MKILLLVSLVLKFAVANALQEAIDNAQAGDTIKLGSGIYEGNIVINKPLSIIGEDKSVVIKGEGRSSVIKIIASDVRLENLKIRGSGDSLSDLDAGISCDGANNVTIKANELTDVLFGVELKQCNASKIVENNITSKAVAMPLRGDAIRLWYSHENLIESNYVHDSRDMVAWYASLNTFRKNHGVRGRYSIHFMYANKNLVEFNTFEGNAVGMFFMYSQGSLVQNNLVINSDGAFGIGIGLKDSSAFTIKNNTLINNARGLLLDASPFQPNMPNVFENNQILHNTIGIQFHATQEPSVFKDNDFIGNMQIASNDTPGSKMYLNQWRGNYFDEYESFDIDKDGFGDTPFLHFIYADQLWQYHPNLQFFYGSSIFSVLNFLAKLAPFSEPVKLLQDDKPRMKPVNEQNLARG